MDQTILAQIKRQLEDEKTKLEKDLAGFSNKDVEIEDNYKSRFPEFGDDEDENAAEVAAFSDNLSIEHTLEKQLRDVNKALTGIKNGTYGSCNHCGKEIEIQRLLIRPVSTSCVSCKKALKGEK